MSFLLTLFFSFFAASQSVDFLQAIDIPRGSLEHAQFHYVNGFDGLPAFQLVSHSDIRKPALNLLTQLYTDWAILVTTKPVSDDGFLFAIVNPLDTLIQFGVRVSQVDDNRTNITLYYTNYASSEHSQVAASFIVPTFMNEWTRFAIQVQGNSITLYLNCEEYEQVDFDRVVGTLPFDPASTLYIGQAGDVFGTKYLVSTWIWL